MSDSLDDRRRRLSDALLLYAIQWTSEPEEEIFTKVEKRGTVSSYVSTVNPALTLWWVTRRDKGDKWAITTRAGCAASRALAEAEARDAHQSVVKLLRKEPSEEKS